MKISSFLKLLFSKEEAVMKELDIINQLLADQNVDFFHLRKPSLDYNEMCTFLAGLNAEYHHKIMIHSHFGLIEKYDLAGINLNKAALNQLAYADEVDKCFIQPMVLRDRTIEINKIVPNRVSYSAHSMEEIQDLAFDTDYVFLSPIFDSISKVDYQSNFNDLESLKVNLKNTKTKVIALGGVKTGNEALLKEIGFSGLARLGDFWNKK
jgi:thiamine-phosphate pyrophosphorylase